MKRLILGGGGNAQDSKLLDKLLVSLISKNKKMLYIPIAFKSKDFDSCYKWITSTFSEIKLRDIKMWIKLNNKKYKDLEKFGAIYLGGGNTFSLLNDLRKSGFIDLLNKFIKSGRPVYGGSAGAIILGKNIKTAFFGGDSDENTVNLNNFSGLNLVRDFSIQCHYTSKDDKEIKNFVKIYGNVIALSERSGLYVQDNKIKVIGYESAYVFKDGKKTEVKIGSFIK